MVWRWPTVVDTDLVPNTWITLDGQLAAWQCVQAYQESNLLQQQFDIKRLQSHTAYVESACVDQQLKLVGYTARVAMDGLNSCGSKQQHL